MPREAVPRDGCGPLRRRPRESVPPELHCEEPSPLSFSEELEPHLCNVALGLLGAAVSDVHIHPHSGCPKLSVAILLRTYSGMITGALATSGGNPGCRKLCNVIWAVRRGSQEEGDINQREPRPAALNDHRMVPATYSLPHCFLHLALLHFRISPASAKSLRCANLCALKRDQ